jgi:hypothetical protein
MPDDWTVTAGQCAVVDITIKFSLLQLATETISVLKNERADPRKNAIASASKTDYGILPSRDFINICASVPQGHEE